MVEIASEHTFSYGIGLKHWAFRFTCSPNIKTVTNHNYGYVVKIREK